MKGNEKMLATEFDEIRRILNGRYGICADLIEVNRWYNELKAWDFAVVKEAVNDWILHDQWKPEVVNIVERCKDVERWKQKIKAAEEPNVKTVACPYCHDRGLIIKTYPNGSEMGHPCPYCSRGKLNYPWEFLSEEEKREYNAKEIKAGRSVPNYYEAPKEFLKEYLYGK